MPWRGWDELRNVFVKEACGEDESMRKEVEWLLAQADVTSNFLDAPALSCNGGFPSLQCPSHSTSRDQCSEKVDDTFGDKF